MRLFWIGAAWLAGIGLGSLARLTTAHWMLLAGIAFSSALWLRNSSRYRWLYLLILMLCLGAARFQGSRITIDPDHVAWYNDSGAYATLTGVIVQPPDVRDSYTGLEVEVEKLRFDGPGGTFPSNGRILVRTSRFNDWAYGDRILIKGYLETPPEFETFSYRDYLARQGIHSMISFASVKVLSVKNGNPLLHVIYAIRNHALRTIQRQFPEPEASLLAGILLGIEQGIPPQVRQAFNDTGTAHIIAISGFNITIIAALLMSLFRRLLGASKGFIAAGVGIIAYTVLVGASAAVVRAAVMGSLTLIALRMGRQTFGLASLSAASIFMTALNPEVLWDVGFQLSFAATLGLMLYAPSFERAFQRIVSKVLPSEQSDRLARPVNEFLLFTFAAQIMTLPLTAFYFRSFPLASLLANPVILPVQAGLMISAGIATIVGMILPAMGQVLAWFAWPFPAFTIKAVTLFSDLPFSTLPLGYFGGGFAVALYVILFALTAFLFIPKEKRPPIRLPAIPISLILVVLAVCAPFLWRIAADRPDGLLHLTIFDVGSGDAALIQSPTGRFMLFDGGPSPIALAENLGARLPLLDRRLDWLVFTGTADNQISGLAETLTRFSPNSVLRAGPARSGPYRYLFNLFSDAEIPIIEAQKGQIFDLGEGSSLHVTQVGSHGALYMLSYGSFQFLLAPGADPKMVDDLAQAALLPVTGVLLPDGGSEALNPSAWLAKLQPLVAVISVEAGNRRGLPSAEVLRALEGTNILRTDVHGWIEFITDGEQLWVEVERNP
ncbi:MAG: ComEC/Rec2 family competence protein [Chloroflexi bacterium]|nr:ComEC/Rec2 family competence protein [Chloroflexota bacterium]